MFGWITKLKEKIAMKYIGSITRTLLGFVSGYLISLGLQPEAVQKFSDSAEVVIAGVITYAITQGWSLLQKQKHSD